MRYVCTIGLLYRYVESHLILLQDSRWLRMLASTPFAGYVQCLTVRCVRPRIHVGRQACEFIFHHAAKCSPFDLGNPPSYQHAGLTITHPGCNRPIVCTGWSIALLLTLHRVSNNAACMDSAQGITSSVAHVGHQHALSTLSQISHTHTLMQAKMIPCPKHHRS